MPNFEEYDRAASWGKRRRAGEQATVTSAGLLSLSPDVREALGHPAAIKFFVDTSERLLGFRAAQIRERNAVRCRAPNHAVSARSVLNLLRVDFGRGGRRYPVQVVDGMHCIDFKKPGTPVTSNRARKESNTPGSREDSPLQ